jgi:RNA polymerase sigma-70 factor (ECF subfamily)
MLMTALSTKGQFMLEQTRRLSPAADAAMELQSGRPPNTAANVADLPDLLLLERARGRDSRACETLIRRYGRRLYRIARSILSSEEHAEGAVQAAYLRAFADLDRHEPAGKFGAWLARLVLAEAHNLKRQLNLVPAGQPALAVAADGGTAPLGAHQLEHAIDRLPEVFRTVFVLRAIEELSGVEVAACLGLNDTTVRTRLYRAQQKLTPGLVRQVRAEAFNLFSLGERLDRVVSGVLGRLHPGNAADPGQR